MKIGLAAGFFGQFGEGSQNAAGTKIHKTNSVRGSLVGADNIAVSQHIGARYLWSRPEHLLLARLFLLFKTPQKGTYAHDTVYKRLLV